MLGLCIFLVSATAVCLTLAIVLFMLYFKTYHDWPMPIACFCAVLGFLGLISSPIAIASYVSLEQVYTKCVANIVSLERDGVVSGRFCLGSGTIEDKQYYFYYTEIKSNTYKLGKIECDDSYIVETDQYEPSIYEIKEKGKPKYYNVYVPFGTMVVSYSV